MLMVDRETGTVWTHLVGNALRGPMEGSRMRMIPVPQMGWGEWKTIHPDTLILSSDTPFQDRYRPVRIGVFRQNEAIFGDERLPANTLVVGVEAGGLFKAYPLEELEKVRGVVNDIVAGEPIVVVYDSAAQSGQAYSRVVEGQVREFYNASPTGFELRDRETDSLWDVLGQALSSVEEGTNLKFIPSFISEWYGWSGYHPETGLFEAG